MSSIQVDVTFGSKRVLPKCTLMQINDSFTDYKVKQYITILINKTEFYCMKYWNESLRDIKSGKITINKIAFNIKTYIFSCS